MDELNYNQLAQRAWQLYKRLDEMSTELESIFAYDFNYLEEKERQIKERQKHLPF